MQLSVFTPVQVSPGRAKQTKGLKYNPLALRTLTFSKTFAI